MRASGGLYERCFTRWRAPSQTSAKTLDIDRQAQEPGGADVRRARGKAAQPNALSAASRAHTDVIAGARFTDTGVALGARAREPAHGAKAFDLTRARRVAHKRKTGLAERAPRRNRQGVAILDVGEGAHRRAAGVLKRGGLRLSSIRTWLGPGIGLRRPSVGARHRRRCRNRRATPTHVQLRLASAAERHGPTCNGETCAAHLPEHTVIGSPRQPSNI